MGSLFIGDPRGMRDLKCGRKHNQRISRWEVGKDIEYLSYKARAAAILCFTGDEQRTSSRCPDCGHRQKVRGRDWRCKACGFSGARDVVGAVNMHRNAFQKDVMFPASVTYLRPGPARVGEELKSPRLAQATGRSSSPDTGRRSRSPLLGAALPGGGQRLPVRRQDVARCSSRQRETKKPTPFRGLGVSPCHI